MTDSSKTKFIIGNMVIPVTDEIEAILKGNYCKDNLAHMAQTYPERIMFLKGSLMVTDGEGLGRWSSITHPERIAKGDALLISEQLGEIKALLANLRNRQDNIFNKFYATLKLYAPQHKPTLFQRIFKRKKQ